MNVTILQDRLPALQDKLEQLNRRAARYNWEPAALIVGEPYKVKVNPPLDPGFDVFAYFVDVTVHPGENSFNGWVICGCVEPGADGRNVVSSIHGETIPHQYRTTNMHCDHCHTDRQRNKVWILRSEDNEYCQVGSTCLSLFTGAQSIEAYAAWLENIADVTSSADEEPFEYDGTPRTRMYVPVVDVIAATIAVVRVNGWVSASQARDSFKTSTASLVRDHFAPSIFVRRELEKVTEDDKTEGAAALAWVRNDLASRPAHKLSDYEWNLTALLTGELTPLDELNKIAPVARMYARHLEDVAKASSTINEWFGKPGDKFVLPLTVVSVHDIESEWGTTHKHVMTDPDGRTFIWWSSSARLAIGQHTIKGTVKAHDEYKGRKQTTVTRCKAV